MCFTPCNCSMRTIASAPVHERTLTGLAVLLQSQALKQALDPHGLLNPGKLI